MTTNSAAIPSGAFAVRVDRISKRYRLYQKPVYRLLDLFGLCPEGPGYYSEHAALKEVDLTIGRGEKVAIIGRNGAGKSTLLKVITGIVRPTSGMVEVSGQVGNLLQIGSGFHPDFTGRQNVFASLAHQGITGAEAARAFDEIVAFAEIEEYIEQPMKTYSTGMCSRLMFSSSVVTKPEILVIDEILGVGDAYFAHKSFERMRDLCTRGGTTLLLVTHDIYSALNLCDRFVWIDRGEVKFDGDSKSAIALYESSIKEQEEHWLRQQNAAKIAAAGQSDRTIIHVLIRSQTGFALPGPLALESIDVQLADGGAATLPVAKGAEGWDLLAEGNLGPVETIAGRMCRAIRTSGSIYHKAEWVVALGAGARVQAATVRCHYRGGDAADLRVFTPDRRLLLAGSIERHESWQERRFESVEGHRKELDLVPQTNYGTGIVRITGVRFLDRDDRDIVEVRHGESMAIRILLRIEPDIRDRVVVFVLGFSRQGSPYSALVHHERLELPPGTDAEILVQIDNVRLGSGAWYVNVGVGEPGLYDKPALKYFTVDPSWYHVLAARLELTVASVSRFDASGCFVVHPATIVARAAVLDHERDLDPTESPTV
ncbi:MAG TPA: ABC transporter ATP-binding protein [Vicinamibacterales bacterium]